MAYNIKVGSKCRAENIYSSRQLVAVISAFSSSNVHCSVSLGPYSLFNERKFGSTTKVVDGLKEFL